MAVIYVRVELWPGGFRRDVRVLGEATIALQSGDADRGNYAVKLSKFGGFRARAGVDNEQLRVSTPLKSSFWRRGRVERFPRRRLGGWDLLLRALAATVGSRNETEDEYETLG